ncbi:hypothetical protein [Pseudozobellia sp. WGM2]|uniref:hypothetical protein n=1 Tax=Pseudozobellia sp. WGM2 TaxID=2787625 RepID=UPI001AE0088B|nr:hypothetical protein [Pseudozobellia sp. WGM2]
MKNYYWWLPCLFLSLSAYSQSDFRKGYIVKVNQDTISGFVDYRSNTSNSKKCIFKKSLDTKSKTYTPSNLISFQFENGKNYKSEEVSIKGLSEKLFLEHLFDGNTNIFISSQNGKEHFYITDEKGKFHELKNDEKEVLRNGKTYVFDSHEYRTTLTLVFYKSKNILNELSTLAFNRKALIKIAKNYHIEITKNESYKVYGEKASKPHQSFGPIIGLSHITVSANNELQNQFYYFKESPTKNTPSPLVGFFYKTNFPKLNERIFLQWSTYISFSNVEWAHRRQESLYHFTEKNNINLKRTLWSNNFSVKYEFPKRKIKPTFQVGAFNNLEISSEYQHDYELKDTNGVTTRTDQTTESPFSKLNLGFLLGTGFQTEIIDKEIYFDFLYQRSGLLDKFEGLNQNIFSLVIGVPIN